MSRPMKLFAIGNLVVRMLGEGGGTGRTVRRHPSLSVRRVTGVTQEARRTGLEVLRSEERAQEPRNPRNWCARRP